MRSSELQTALLAELREKKGRAVIVVARARWEWDGRWWLLALGPPLQLLFAARTLSTPLALSLLIWLGLFFGLFRYLAKALPQPSGR